jgi:DMSO/TMAO reductase YedYZ molybdopterin-dependent catalytic subunit
MTQDSARTSLPPADGGLVIRQKSPNNMEMPFDTLGAFLTQNELFYIRSHFSTPNLCAESFKLLVDGAVLRTLALNYSEIRAMPSIMQVATLECAGNGRVFLSPPASGAQWELGAVGNAAWTGVRLSDILERAGLTDDAVEVILEGADHGMPKEPPVPHKPISYARSVSRTKALSGEVILAYQMNGRDLSADHGYPLRAIVPGHYGMASTKWLTHIRVVAKPFLGYWQTADYGYWEEHEGTLERRPLSEMRLKSQIARPRPYERLVAGNFYMIVGATWAGDASVSGVEVSTDNGLTWREAAFVDPSQPYAWRRWELGWNVPAEPGRYTLLSRARDVNGVLQPAGHDARYGTYVINYPLPIEIFVDLAR